MRILRLDLEQGATGIDLHPFLTVVHGLTPGQRTELIDAIRSLARGSATGIRGLLQNQGLLVELDGTGNSGLCSLTGADVIVDTDASQVHDLPRLQSLIDQKARQAEIDAVSVEEVRADLDPSARSRVATLEARLDLGDEAATTRRRLDTERIRRGLESLRSHDPSLWEAPDGVVALRERLERYKIRVEESEQHFAHLETAVHQAEVRLKAARTSQAEAERLAHPVLLTRDEEARLELLSFPGMDETRRGKWRKLLRPEERAEMEALLARVGVESWTAYTVYRVDPMAPAHLRDEAAAARQASEEAEEYLEEARRTLASDSLALELNQELLDIRRMARQHLGLMLPPDLGRALNDLVVERVNPAWLASLEAMRQLLAEVGIDADLVGSGQPGADGSRELAAKVVATAESWLERQVAVDRDLGDESLRIELSQARRLLDRHRRALARIGRAEAAAEASADELAELRAEADRRAAGGPQSADAVLAQVGMVATQVAVDARGSLPSAVIGDFAGLPDDEVMRVLDRCSQLAGGLQVIMITDRRAALDWAGDAGLGLALVSRAKPLAGDGATLP